MVDMMLEGLAILGLAVFMILLIGVIIFSASALCVMVKSIFTKWFRK